MWNYTKFIQTLGFVLAKNSGANDLVNFLVEISQTM